MRRIAVITPVYISDNQSPNRDWLLNCLRSVKAQSIPCQHYLVLDGQGSLDFIPQELMPKIIQLPDAHHDYGDTPRAIGSITAFRQGYQAVAWLDYDNWFESDHIEQLVKAQKESGSSVSVSSRKIYDLEGHEMGPCPETGNNFFDTNCYLISEAERAIVSLWWLMDEDAHRIGDRILLNYLQTRNITVAFNQKPTLCYRSNFESHYVYFAKPIPPTAKKGFSAC